MDEQDAVAVADLADTRIVAVGRDERVGGRATDRLHDEGNDAFRSLGEDFFLQHVGIFQAALLQRKVVAVAIGRRAPGSVGISRIWLENVSVSAPSPVTASAPNVPP